MVNSSDDFVVDVNAVEWGEKKTSSSSFEDCNDGGILNCHLLFYKYKFLWPSLMQAFLLKVTK
jgi:hypothetical protein